MRSAFFIDIDTIIKDNIKPWVISLNEPNKPIIKIEEWEFNVFLSGVYKNHGNKIEFNGKTFWLSNDFFNKLKSICKRNKIDISTLAISLQEYLNLELIDESDIEIDLSVFQDLINKNSDIFLFLSKRHRNYYKKQLLDLEEKLKDIGLVIKNSYSLTKNFINKNNDEISWNKAKIICQHIVGLKMKNNLFTNESILEYDHITYIDKDNKSIELLSDINNILDNLAGKSDDYINKIINNKLKQIDKKLLIRKKTENKANKFIDNEIDVRFNSLIKKFESYTLINDNKKNIEEWAYNYAKDNHQGFNYYEEAVDYLEYFLDKWKKMEQKITLYRIINVDKPSNIIKKRVGRHFVDYPDAFNDYNFLQSIGFSRGDVENGNFFIIQIEVDKDQIDIKNTIVARLNHPYEEEFTLYDNSKYKIIKIEKKIYN